MPKNNDLNLIAQAVEQPPLNPEKSTHYLFLLGTDTEYTFKSTKDYARAETFSYLANVVATQLNEAPTIQDEVLAFSTESIDLLNGPSTLGPEVGHRIAQGLFLVLKAIAKGKDTIKILAHSRGAVQAILITHELERIRQELQQNKDISIFEILARSPCPYTKNAVSELFKDIHESEEIRNKLYERLAQIDFKLELFLIDPVPGGSWFGLGNVVNIAWKNEPRFYQKLPCNKTMLFICMDERTRCFIPIVPEGSEIIPIPGTHGTPSGNLNDQQGQPVPEEHAGDTGLVQQLTIFKALEFIEGDTLFISSRGVIDLRFPELDKITNAFITTNECARPQTLFGLYDAIQKNIQAYKYFRNTSYKYLGSEASNFGDRYIHAGGHNYVPLASLIPNISTHFVNKEHARLYLLTQMRFDFSVSALEPDSLKEKIKELADFICENLTLCQYSFSSSSSSSQPRRSLQLIASEENRTIVFEAMSIFLDQMGQIYLRNHISHDNKKALLGLIQDIFEQIQNINDPNIQLIRDEYLRILKTSLKKTVNTQYLSLIDQFEGYSRRFEYYQQQNALQAIISKVPVLAENFEGIQNLGDLNLKLNEINDQEEKNRLQELLVDTLEIKDYLDICNSQPEEIILELEKLYENLDHLIHAVPILMNLTNDSLDINAEYLPFYKDRIIKFAASLVTRDRGLLNRIHETFCEEVQSQAIGLGLESKELIILKESIKKNAQKLEETEALIQEFIGLNRGLEKLYYDLKGKYNELDQKLLEFTKSNEDLTAQNKILDDENKILEDQNQALEAQNQALNSPEESACLNQIFLKLLPLTQEYRDHLWEEACKINQNIVSEELLPKQLPDLADAHPSYKALVTKYAFVNELLDHLRDVDKNPSKRLEAFATELEKANDSLSAHRDPKWSRYLKNCMIALLVIGTGILPGLLVLSIYASCTNRSLFFFNQSKGNEFVEQATKLTFNV